MRAQLVLEQPHAPPAQQHIDLASDWAYLDSGPQRRELLLDFPLPGRKEGPRDFRIYLDLPAGAEVATISQDASGGGRGFFIQEVGRMRGKAVITHGTVRLQDNLWTLGQPRVDLDVRCDDGTRISGSARPTLSGQELGAFRRRYAADIAALHPEVARSQLTAGPPGAEGAPAVQDPGAGAAGNDAAAAPTASRPSTAP